jgi:2-amino-4-hydroxy-6-hydroxymethyldihydropteridine diphosphokinase
MKITSNSIPLVLALGTNLGDKKLNLENALRLLALEFTEISRSSIYVSEPVEYLNQDDFYNMVAAYTLPQLDPVEVLSIIKKIELQLGRAKTIPKGPRIIDIDIILMGEIMMISEELSIPHPNFLKRSFVCLPLLELGCAKTIQQQFAIPTTFESRASRIISF